LSSPRIENAAFGPSGAFVNVEFDQDTNRASLLWNEFACSQLLDFDQSSDTLCRWSSEKILRVTLNALSKLQIGSKLRLVSFNSLQRKSCESMDLYMCNPHSNYTDDVTIGGPSEKTPVEVSFIAPAIFSVFDRVVLDFSKSFPSGGRPWVDVSIETVNAFEISSNSPVDTTSINHAIGQMVVEQKSRETGYLVVASSTFSTQNVKFSWKIKLQNWLLQEGLALSSNVTVVGPGNPSVSILGSARRSILRNQSVTLRAAAQITNEFGQANTTGLSYDWIVTNFETGAEVGIVSTSADQRSFRIAPFSLISNTAYNFTVIVTSTSMNRRSAASAVVEVRAGDVVAQISGPSERSFRDRDIILLDASGSYATDGSVERSFFWNCSLQSYCPVELLANNSSAIRIKANLVNLDCAVLSWYSAFINVVVSYNSRSAIASVRINVACVNTTAVSVVSSPAQKLNAEDSITIVASIATESVGTAYWSVLDVNGNDAGIDLSSRALSPISMRLSIQQIRLDQSVYVSLVLPGNVLIAGVGYSFSLTYIPDDNTPKRSCSVLVKMNSAPIAGRIRMNNWKGTMLKTVFEFSASLWSDEDLPLQYEFSFSTTDESLLQTFDAPPDMNSMLILKSDFTDYIVIRARSELSFFSSVLPQGPPQYSNAVSVRCRAFDALNAQIKNHIMVQVEPSPITVKDMTAAINTIVATDERDNDMSRSKTAFYSTILNTGNCSHLFQWTGGRSCSELGRFPCTVVDNTCGPCRPGYYGDGPYSNAPCATAGEFVGATRRRQLQDTCSSKADCVGLQDCVNSKCISLERSCPNDCSGKGKCIKFRLHQEEERFLFISSSKCQVGDVNCYAECVCNPSYGGESCSIETDLLESRRRLRLQMLEKIMTDIMVSEDQDDPINLESWLSTLSVISRKRDEMEIEAKFLLYESLRTIVEAAITYNISHRVIEERFMECVEYLSSGAFKSTGSLVDFRKSNFMVLNLTNLFGALVSKSVSVGQNPLSFKSDAFSLISGVSDIQSNQSSFYNLVSRGIMLPISELEMSKNISPHLVSFPVCGVESSFNIPSYYMGASRLKYASNSSFFTSDILTVQLSSDYFRDYDMGKCSILISMQNAFSVNFSAIVASAVSARANLLAFREVNTDTIVFAEDYSAQIKCYPRRTETFDVRCPEGDRVQVHCDGKNSGMFAVSCPRTFGFLKCNPIDLKSNGDIASLASECSVVEYDEKSAKCFCDVSSGDISSGISIASYVLSVNTSRTESILTFSTAGYIPEDTSQSSWIVVSTTSAIVASLLLLSYWGVRLDSGKSGKILGVKKGEEVGKSSYTEEDLDRTLPAIFQNFPIMNHLARELSIHHKWLNVVFAFSEVSPRSRRCLSLGTSVLIVLLIDSICIDYLLYPDDGSCRDYLDVDDCLSDMSSIVPFSICVWSSLDPFLDVDGRYITGTCDFREPRDNMFMLVVAVVVSLLIATPIYCSCDYALMHIFCTEHIGTNSRNLGHENDLLADSESRGFPKSDSTRKAESTKKIHQRRLTAWITPSSSVASVIPDDSPRMDKPEDIKGNIEGLAEVDMISLTSKIDRHRSRLNIVDCRTFDGNITALLNDSDILL
jgi:hypothetical protein